jgi:hypothetical protein
VRRGCGATNANIIYLADLARTKKIWSKWNKEKKLGTVNFSKTKVHDI